MESDTWLFFVIFIVLVSLSAFFSGSESAFFSIQDSELKEIESRKKRSHRKSRVLWLMQRQRRLLMTLLIGNTVVNVGAATTAAIFTASILPVHGPGSTLPIIIEIAVVTLILLVFSEVSPKVFAVKNPMHFAETVSMPVVFLVRLLSPAAWLAEKVTNLFQKMLRITKEMPFINEEELKALIDVGTEKGALDHTEREMIHSIFEFRETMAKEVMIPRTDMVCIDETTSFDEVISIIKKHGHSRIPVYRDTIDDIKGLLYVKDLLPFFKNGKTTPKIASLLHNAYFIPESKRIDELLKEFQKERMHMAVVVDEYGGTAGLVTMEDIIEEIVGEIRDEFDYEKPLLQKIDERTWVIEGKIDVEDMNEKTGLHLPDDQEYESLGGFIFEKLGHIPEEQEEFEWSNVRFIIEKVQKQRVRRVKVILTGDAQREDKETI